MLDTTVNAAPISLAYPVNGRYPQLHVHSKTETVSNFVRRHHIWQRPITTFLTAHLRPGDVFVDVGANIGYFSVYAGLLVGDQGKVHAIEPVDENLAILDANISLNSLTNVTVHRLAASSENGTAPLYCSASNGGAHSLLPQSGLRQGPAVPLETLDDLLAEERTPKLIKIDVQGAELDVLRGATRLLDRRDARPSILFEFSPLLLQRSDRMEELFDFVARGDYSLRAFIANERATVTPPRLRRSTVLAIAQDLLSCEDAAEFDLLLVPNGR